MRPLFLHTERLGFGLWSDADFDLASTLWGNAEVMRFMGGPLPPERIRARLAREIDHQTRLGFAYWPLFARDSGEFAGCCGLRPHGEIHALGFHLLPEQWGRGYAAEAGRAAIDYAFDVLGLQELFAGHHPQNDRSRKVLQSLGFVYWRDDLYPPTGLMHPGYLLRPSSRAPRH